MKSPKAPVKDARQPTKEIDRLTDTLDAALQQLPSTIKPKQDFTTLSEQELLKLRHSKTRDVLLKQKKQERLTAAENLSIPDLNFQDLTKQLPASLGAVFTETIQQFTNSLSPALLRSLKLSAGFRPEFKGVSAVVRE